MLKKIFRSKQLDKQLSEQRPRLYRLANSWCGDGMLADDLVQETLNKALLKQEQLKDFSRFEAWLYRILHNCWMEYLRAKKPTLDIDEVTLTTDETPERQLTEQQIIFRVRQTMKILPLTQRQVITLVDLEGCSYAEVAEILEIPLGTVMSRLNRARIMLKKHLTNIQNTHPLYNHLRRVK
jgi:RNA polymerase sigma-70 factor (ECF subfamily)